MKNFKFLLIAVVMLAVGSAFTTQRSSQEIYIQTSSGVYEPLGTEGPGECIESGDGCHFEKTGENQYEALDSDVWLPA